MHLKNTQSCHLRSETYLQDLLLLSVPNVRIEMEKGILGMLLLRLGIVETLFNVLLPVLARTFL